MIADYTRAGIDYSISNPALAVLPAGLPFEFKNIRFYYTTEKPKYAKKYVDNIDGFLQPSDYDINADRYNFNAATFTKILTKADAKHVRIEDYAYGSSAGLVFQIGEHTGVLKHYLWQSEIAFSLISPTAVKKLATGKGKGIDKNDMYAAFFAETGVDLKSAFGMKTNVISPLGDIVDAYYMLKSLVLDDAKK